MVFSYIKTMKIIYKKELKDLAKKLGEILGARTQERKNERTQDDEMTVFVGRGLANEALKTIKKYPKCFEIGNRADSFDYLGKILLNDRTAENDRTHGNRRKNPERIVAQKFDYDCGGAAVSTLLLMLQREEILKTNIYERLMVNPIDGTKSIYIKKLFDDEDIPFLEVWKADLTDVENVLKNGGVLLVSYQAWGNPEEIKKLECGHYSIIFDIDKDFVWLIDPSAEVEYIVGSGIGVVKRPRKEFEKLWIDKGADGEIYDKWMMAVRI